VEFNEVNIGELSTINVFSDKDGHAESRNNGKTYKVKTISLDDMCEKYSAPKNIDYLSIDTCQVPYDCAPAE